MLMLNSLLNAYVELSLECLYFKYMHSFTLFYYVGLNCYEDTITKPVCVL